jgi:hypothetical protein
VWVAVLLAWSRFGLQPLLMVSLTRLLLLLLLLLPLLLQA